MLGLAQLAKRVGEGRGKISICTVSCRFVKRNQEPGKAMPNQSCVRTYVMYTLRQAALKDVCTSEDERAMLSRELVPVSLSKNATALR